MLDDDTYTYDASVSENEFVTNDDVEEADTCSCTGDDSECDDDDEFEGLIKDCKGIMNAWYSKSGRLFCINLSCGQLISRCVNWLR